MSHMLLLFLKQLPNDFGVWIAYSQLFSTVETC